MRAKTGLWLNIQGYVKEALVLHENNVYNNELQNAQPLANLTTSRIVDVIERHFERDIDPPVSTEDPESHIIRGEN